MPDDHLREPDQIRRDCAGKLLPVNTGGMFTAILGCLLGEDWSTPRIEELRVTPEHGLLARVEGEVTFEAFLRAEAAALDGDELGFLPGRVAEIKAAR